ncbi:MAG: hypothetical protein ABGX27_00730 [Desulfurobacteriaceae bacterium]
MDYTKLYLIVVGAVAFGYVLASILVETNLVNWLGLKTIKLSRLGIHPLLTNVPVIHLVSPRAAHIAASKLLNEGKVEPLDLYLTVLASNFPMRLMFLYKYFFPVLIPLIGVIAVYYGILRLLFDAAILVVVSIVGRIRYKKLEPSLQKLEKVKVELSLSFLKKGFLKGVKEAFSFIVKFTPLFFLIVFLMEAGIMEKLVEFLKPIFGKLGFDSLEITYITTCAISPPVAYGLVNVMVEKGYSVAQILGTMAVGNAMFSILRSWWMYLLPYYVGLYPLKVVATLLILQAFLPAFYNFVIGIILVNLS